MMHVAHGWPEFPDASAFNQMVNDVKPCRLQRLDIAPHAAFMERTQTQLFDQIIPNFSERTTEPVALEELQDFVLSNKLFVAGHGGLRATGFGLRASGFGLRASGFGL